MCSGSEEGSYFRLIDFLSLNSRLESNKEEKKKEANHPHAATRPGGKQGHRPPGRASATIDKPTEAVVPRWARI